MDQITNHFGIKLKYWTDALVDEILYLDSYRVRPWINFHKPDVLDIGSNLGIFALLALQAECHVCCVEPEPQTMEKCKENFDLNSDFIKTSIFMVECAVYKENCTMDLFYTYRPNNEGIHGDHYILGESNIYNHPPGADGKDVKSIKVDCVTLKDLVEKFKRIEFSNYKFLKVDTEGAEVDIFTDNNIDELKYFDVIVTEIHRSHMIESCRDAIEKAGFETYLCGTGYGFILHGLKKNCNDKLNEHVRNGWYAPSPRFRVANF